MSEDSLLPFDLPSVARKKVSVGFDGGLLVVGRWRASAARRREEARAGRAACVVHPGSAQARGASCTRLRRCFGCGCLRSRRATRTATIAIALRHDPIFKMAVGHAPESGDPLCSQPTMSRLENAPSKIEIARLMAAMVDQFCDSYRRAPSSITLDIDDTFDAVHGHQQLSLFNAHYDERCFLPIHIYEAASGKPVAMILREGKTPSGEEVRTVLKHVIRRIRRHWPKVHILVRGDSHYGRDEAMEWCEENQGIDYVFGFAGNEVLHTLTRDAADAVAVQRALSGKDKVRGFMAFRYGAKSWDKERRFVARIEATPKGTGRPLCRHLAQGRRQASLRDHLLRAGQCRELHQAAQEPARLRPHLMPRAEGQSVPSDPSHRRLLAHAGHAPRRTPSRSSLRTQSSRPCDFV